MVHLKFKSLFRKQVIYVLDLRARADGSGFLPAIYRLNDTLTENLRKRVWPLTNHGGGPRVQVGLNVGHRRPQWCQFIASTGL